MARKIVCKTPGCGNTYFIKLEANEFYEHSRPMHQPLKEVDSDTNIKLYQCVACKQLFLPPIDYHSSTEEDQSVYKYLTEIIDGIAPAEATKPMRKQAAPGGIRYQNPFGTIGGDL